MLKPSFFTNENLIELPFEFRLLFAGLWCHADRDGRLEDRPKRLKLQIFPADAVDVDAGLQALHDAGFIQRYEVNGQRYISICKFSAHQNPHHKETSAGYPQPPESLVKTQCPEKTWLAPEKPGLPGGDLGLGSGDLGLGTGDGKAAPLVVGIHSRPSNLINGSDQRRHGQHAWCDPNRGLCVPFGLHDDFVKRGQKSPEAMKAWYASVVLSLDGVPVGDDLFDFWRNQFAAWIGTVTTRSVVAATRSGDSMSAAKRSLKRELDRIAAEEGPDYAPVARQIES